MYFILPQKVRLSYFAARSNALMNHGFKWLRPDASLAKFSVYFKNVLTDDILYLNQSFH